MVSSLNRAIGRRLAVFLSKSLPGYYRFDAISIESFAAVIRPGDILLVEGSNRISIAIKYLTQSSWSHAALCIEPASNDMNKSVLLEADLQNGVHQVPLSKYADSNLRLCRPVGLSTAENQQLISFAKSKLGYQYDLKNIFDLLRYLIQKPAVPNRMRRSMIGLGSGEPTKAICSTLIAQSFQSINYPILPRRGKDNDDGEVPAFYRRHFTHYTPRDFDVSPYFEIIKPTIAKGFNFRELQWQLEPDSADTLDSEGPEGSVDST
jgi:hypothetical protein